MPQIGYLSFFGNSNGAFCWDVVIVVMVTSMVDWVLTFKLLTHSGVDYSQ